MDIPINSPKKLVISAWTLAHLRQIAEAWRKGTWADEDLEKHEKQIEQKRLDPGPVIENGDL